jgi:hypothetical protein
MAAAAAVRGPVDVNGVTLVAGGPGEVPKDRKTGEILVDRRTGARYWVISLVVFVPGEPIPQVWKVKVMSEPKGIVQGEPVKVSGLMFSEWTMSEDGKTDRHGVSFKAETVEPLVLRKAAAA